MRPRTLLSRLATTAFALALGIGCSQGVAFLESQLCTDAACGRACDDLILCPVNLTCIKGHCGRIPVGGVVGNPFNANTIGQGVPGNGLGNPNVLTCAVKNSCGNCLPPPYCSTNSFSSLSSTGGSGTGQSLPPCTLAACGCTDAQCGMACSTNTADPNGVRCTGHLAGLDCLANVDGTTTCGIAQVAAAGAGGSYGGNLFPVPADPNAGIVQNGDGSLSLANGAAVNADFAWPANTREGTVSRVDMILAAEVGRYPSVVRRTNLDPANPSSLLPVVPEWNSQCNQPSRTTVDQQGNAYVSNRANREDNQGTAGNCPNVVSSYIGSVTKIGRYDVNTCDGSKNPGLTGCNCHDFNGNGTIETSRDIDGNGHINLDLTCQGSLCSTACTQDTDCTTANPNSTSRYCFTGQCSTVPREYLAYADECALWTVPLPTNIPGQNTALTYGAKGRGMATDASGYIWASDYGRSFESGHGPGQYKLRPSGPFDANFKNFDPSVTAGLDRPVPADPNVRLPLTVSPYGTVIDGQHNLYNVDINRGIEKINTLSGLRNIVLNQGSSSGVNNYGVTIDSKGRVWTAEFFNSTGVPNGLIYDPNAAAALQLVKFNSNGADNQNNYIFNGTKTTYFYGRGLTTATSTTGDTIWGIFDGNQGGDWLVSFDPNGNVLTRINTKVQMVNGKQQPLLCSGPIGVGLGAGANPKVWMVSRGNNSICSYDPVSFAFQVVPIGDAPYTYSDFTGNILRNFTSPSGFYTLVIDGCGSPNFGVSHWGAATITGATPGASQIIAKFRTASRDPSTGLLNFSSAFTQGAILQGTTGTLNLDLSTAPYAVTQGNFLQVQFNLLKDGNTNLVPTLKGFNVARSCQPSGGG